MGQPNSLLRFGQRVRVMQTTDMEEAGLANRLGTVSANQRTPSHMVTVAMDDGCLRLEQRVELPSHSLMVITHEDAEAAREES